MLALVPAGAELKQSTDSVSPAAKRWPVSVQSPAPPRPGAPPPVAASTRRRGAA